MAAFLLINAILCALLSTAGSLVVQVTREAEITINRQLDVSPSQALPVMFALYCRAIN
jgi:hypothetical protein